MAITAFPTRQPETAPAHHTSARPLRVLLTGYRSHPHVGGQGVYLRELARALTGLGHLVSVASGPPYPELDPGVELIEFPSLDLFSEPNALSALRPRHLLSRADMSEWLAHNSGGFGELHAFGLRLEAWLARSGREFDVIHDNQTLSAPFLRIARRIPVIATIHHPVEIDRAFALDAAGKRIDRWLTRRWYGFTEAQARTIRTLPRLLAVSQAARDSHVEWYGADPARIKVAFNGIDHAVFRPDPSALRQPGLIAATASADVPIKGLDVLIAAFAKLAAERPGVRLEIIGKLREGGAKQALEATGFAERVLFRDGLRREAVADLYRRAQIMACPARFEGFGFPAAEAMACGAAVVASDGGALPEVVGEAGVIVPAGDADALAAAIGALLDDPERARALGEAAAARALAAFDWETHALAATALYTQALADAHRPA